MSEIESALHALGVELRIAGALQAYAAQVGHDDELEAFQIYRASEVYDALAALLAKPHAVSNDNRAPAA
jgi:hypothetical protein